MTLTELLKGKPAASFDSQKLMNKAHWRWERDQAHAAFLLFEAAAERALAEVNTNREEACRNRAAVALHQSGTDPTRARLLLDGVLAHHERNPDRTLEAHFAEWAATALLEQIEAESADAFTNAFRRLQERCRTAGREAYPRISGQQESIAERAFELGAWEVLDELIEVMEKRRPMPRVLKRRLKAWRVR